MAVKTFSPTTPSLRSMQVLVHKAEITTDKPERSLVKGKKSTGGRNNYGRITTRFRGAGNKRRYREIDCSSHRAWRKIWSFPLCHAWH